MNNNILSTLGVSDTFFQALDQVATLLGLAMGLTWFAGLLLAYFKPDSLRRWFSRNRFPSIGGRPDLDWQGLVFTVSRADVPEWVIAQVNPQHIGLLVSDAMQNVGETIRNYAAQRGIQVDILSIHDPNNPAEVKQHTKQLLTTLQEHGLQHLAVDITGGKVPMSVGAFMAAEEMGCDSIYVATDYINGKPDMSSANLIAISQNRA